MRELELYLHIPFCVRKCAYCDFLSAPADRARQEEYLRALKREIEMFPDRETYRVSSVFFGGGTPSILPGERIAELMELLRREFQIRADAEVTLECNPGTADAEKLRIFRETGINRLSLGLQSADERELALLGRIHTWADFLRTFDTAREAGFSNINVDLMSALPGQTVRSWERTLARVLALAPEHISAYSLIIEEGTPFYERYHEDAEKRERGEQPENLPSEDEEREMYQLTEQMLAEAGLNRYEISNYALPGYECRHNIGYWTGAEYAGFGLGASSLLRLSRELRYVDYDERAERGGHIRCDERTATSGYAQGEMLAAPARGSEQEDARSRNLCHVRKESVAEPASIYVRVRNPESMQAYLDGDFSGREITPLSEEDRMAEFMFLGLRLIEGVSEREFRERFGGTIEETYGKVLEKYTANGLLARENGRIALTARGLDLSNVVMADFIIE